MDRFVVISADCHATARPDQYADYVEARFQQDFDEYRRQIDAVSVAFDKGVEEGGRLFSKEAVDEYRQSEEVHEGVGGGTSGQWDSALRAKELEADGVVAEVLFPNGSPFMAGFGTTYSAELQAAGKRAYNRWLADFCADLPGRRAGIAQLDLHDVDGAVAEVEWAAAHGLRGVMLPISFDDAPPIYHDRYEPLWSACEDTGLPLHIHGGGGPDYGVDGMLAIMLYVSEVTWWPRRPLWFMIWSGAFERHPGLRMVFTENTAAWIPETLKYLDFLYKGKLFGAIRSEVPHPPSEYWRRQCYVGASFISDEECDMREQIGVDKIMFGNDYPHLEGTWPRTKQWLQATVGGLPEADARSILGENAARVYGFDLPDLSALAESVGPSLGELAERKGSYMAMR